MLYKNSAIAFLIKVLSAGVALGVNAYITNILSVEAAGQYYFMMSVVMFFNPICIFGMNNFVLKNISKDEFFKDAQKRNTLLSNGIFLSLTISCIVVGLMLVFKSSILYYFFDNKVDETTYSYLLYSVPIFSGATILCHALQATGKVHLSMIYSGPVLQVVFLFYIFSLGSSNADQVSKGYLFSNVIFLFLTLLTWYYFNGVSRCKNENTTSILKSGYSLMSIQLLGVVYLSLSQILLGLSGNVSNVAAFAICLKISSLLSFVLQAVNKIVAPEFSKLYHQNNIEELKVIVKKSTRILVAACLPLVIFLMVFSSDILAIFGSEYGKYSWILITLLLAQLVNICTGTVSYLLMMTGHEKQHRNNVAISTFISLSVGGVIIPLYGTIGALIMVCSALVITNVLSWYKVKIHMGIDTLKII